MLMEFGLILGALGLLLAVRVPVAAALAGLGMFLFVAEGSSLTELPARVIEGLHSPNLLCIPLFLLMSSLLLKAGVAQDLYRAARCWFSRCPSGLAAATLVSCVLFSALSGSSVAAAASIGTVALPELTGRGYPRPFVFGLLAVGGALGILLPPSLALIVFGLISGVSLQVLLLAAVGPALLLLAMLLAGCAWYVRQHPVCRPPEPLSREARRLALARAWPPLALAAGLAVMLYAGLPPALVAVLALAGSWPVVMRTGQFTHQKMLESLESAMRATVMLYLLILGAEIFSHASDLAALPAQIAIAAQTLNPTILLFLVALGLLIAGLFIEALPLILILVPALLPALHAAGVETIWFGVFFVLLVEAALILPPFGLNLFVIQALGKARLDEVSWGAAPFVLILLASAVLLWIWPAVVLGIPGLF